MRVAIIGAGLSGLACACRLEQLGFAGQLDIFEEKGSIEEENVFAEFISELFHRPVRDMLAYLNQKYNLYLQPVQSIYASQHFGPSRSSQHKGFLGYVITRGGHPLSLDMQLYAKLKTPVQFNTPVAVADIKAEYDYVVVATSELADIPAEVGVRVDCYAHFYHALVKGRFEPSLVKLWLNEEYAPNGYGYLLPIDEHTATVALITPDREFSLRQGWDRFIEQVWNDALEIKELHEVIDMPLGEPDNCSYHNLLFVGLAAGAVLPAMGYGLHTSMLTGIYAADAIVKGKDYTKLLEQRHREYQWSLALRRRLESLSNEDYDRVIDWLGSPLGRYVLRPGKPNILKAGGLLFSLLDNPKRKSVYPDEIPRFRGRTLVVDKNLREKQLNSTK